MEGEFLKTIDYAKVYSICQSPECENRNSKRYGVKMEFIEFKDSIESVTDNANFHIHNLKELEDKSCCLISALTKLKFKNVRLIIVDQVVNIDTLLANIILQKDAG